MRLGIKGKQVLGVTSIVGVVVVLLSLLYLARRACGQRDFSSRARGRDRGYRPGRRVPGAARRPGPPVHSRIEPLFQECHLRRDRRRQRAGCRRRGSRARRWGAAGERRSRRARRAICAVPVAGHLSRTGAEPRVQADAAARRHRFRIDPHRRLDVADPPGSGRLARPGGRNGRRRARARGRRRDAPGAAPAETHSRHSQRSHTPGPRRGGRAPRSRRGRRVRRAWHLLQHRQRAAVGRPIAHGRPSGEPRVGRAVPRRRSCHHQPARRAAVRQPGHAGAVAGRDARDLARTPRRRQSSASRVGRADAREPRLERAGFGAFP